MAERDDLWQAIFEASPYNAPVPCKHFAHRQQGGWDACAECEADGIYAAVIKHLTESGRLLPSGGEVSEEVARGIFGVDYRRSVTFWPDGTKLFGPWSPVLSDNSEVPNGN